MPASEFTCPHCLYQAPLSYFDNVGGGQLKCRRCRSEFADPNAYAADTTYADCDSLRPVTRFPFTLNGNNSMIRVRAGYLALIVGVGGVRMWIEEPSCHIITDMPDGFQLYYVCLTPRIIWGAGIPKGVGAYGSAQLSISTEYVKDLCAADGHILALEKQLKDIVNRAVTDLIRTEADRNTAGRLESREVYQTLLRPLENGVSLARIDPMGFRNGSATMNYFSSYEYPTEPAAPAAPADPMPEFRPPADIISKLPKQPYTIPRDVEEVVIRSSSKADRHKAEEKIDASILRGAEKLVRFNSKEFEFPYGWGVYNLPKPVSGYYSAQGTVSFFVDSTERLSLYLTKTRSWQEFEERFFTNIFKKELAAALRELLNVRVSRQGVRDDRILDLLSEMSIELTDLLNGEGKSAREPAFRQYGLRIKQADILSIDFYTARR